MTPLCKACGVEYDPRYRSDLVLHLLGVAEAPVWLDCLCNECLHVLSGQIDYDYEADHPLTPVTEEHLTRFLCEALGEIAKRLAQGRPAIRCQAFVDGRYIGERPHRCTRFASHEVEGKMVCGPHKLAIIRGREVAWTPDAARRVPPIVIWARSAEEFLYEAKLIAETLFSNGSEGCSR